MNYFGFWLDDDFGSGHSRGQPSCTTYGSPPLSAQEEFKIDKLEAWGVGVPPENEVRLGNGLNYLSGAVVDVIVLTNGWTKETMRD